MLKICHRINNIEQLHKVPLGCGVEMDIHAFGNRLVVHHDPFVDAVDFEDWLECFNHAFLILNIKEEGIEQKVKEIVLRRGIENFFMLDLSFPALIKMVKSRESRVAVRVSCYEPVEVALSLANLAAWVWLDLFQDEFPLNSSQIQALKGAQYKICLVSPELHGREISSITDLRLFLEENNIVLDAVCTKYPELW
ncbi:MAG: hypothetical protein K0R24_223 [Gammaproteobacteria bacterium]|jgi:hypothetical protein|nr:hypothetical protein [Gammaproteobacteria bacterium]